MPQGQESSNLLPVVSETFLLRSIMALSCSSFSAGVTHRAGGEVGKREMRGGNGKRAKGRGVLSENSREEIVPVCVCVCVAAP